MSGFIVQFHCTILRAQLAELMEFICFLIIFSFSLQQSGKLVMKMFQKIQELIDDKDALVCVLIDEVF